MHFEDATKNRSERREAVGVQTEARRGRVDQLPPGEGAGELAPLEQPWTETASEEQVSGNTVLLLRIVAEKQPPDVEESDRQAKRSRSDVSLAMDAQMGKIAQGKSHDGGTIDPEHRHECTKVQNWKMNQNKQCSGLLRLSPTCSARARSRVKHPAGWLHPGCA